MVGSQLLPDPLHASLVSITLRGGAVSSSVGVSTDAEANLGTYTVPAKRSVTLLEVVPPTSSGGFSLGVSSGAVDMKVVSVAWFADATALNAAGSLLGSSATAPKAMVTLSLPTKAQDATAVYVELDAQSASGKKAVFTIWPAGAARGGHPVVGASFGSGAVHQLIVTKPGRAGSLSLTASGASAWTAQVVGWSSNPQVNTAADNVTVASSSDVAIVSGVGDPSAPGVISYAGAKPLQPGDILAVDPSATSPDGMLLKVTGLPSAPAGVRPSDAGTQTLAVAPATLGDVLPSGDFSQVAPVDSGDAPPITDLPPLPPDAPPSPPNSDGSPSVATITPNASHSVHTSASTGGGTGGSASFVCSRSATATVSASLQVYGNVNLSASWVHLFGSPTADFGFTGGISGQLRAGVSGQASCTGSATIPGPHLPTIKFVVGGVPVWVVPEVSLNLSLSGSVASSINATAGFNAQFNAGVHYAGGSFSPYRNASVSFPSSLDARAGGQVEVDVTPRLDFKVYGIAGPYVTIGAFAALDVNLGRTPWWMINAGMRAGVGFSLDLGFTKFNYDAGTIELFRHTVAQASSPFPGPTNGGGSGNGTVGSSYDLTLQASGGRAPYSWYRVSGLLPPGLTLRTDGHLVGVPTATGTWSFVVRVIDGAGNRIAADQTVTVSFNNPPPPPPPGRSVSASKGGSAQGRSGCTSSACAYLVVSFSNFGGGAHTVTCNASNTGEWYRYTTSATTTAYCYYGYPGQTVWATVDGVGSNSFRW